MAWRTGDRVPPSKDGIFAVVERVRRMGSRRSESDTQWEYETLRPPRGETRKEAGDPKDAVNELAAEGWRLVDTIEYTGGGTKYLVFERPAGSDDAEREGSS
jgi:hypothetical protein